MGKPLRPRSGNVIGVNVDPNPRSSLNVVSHASNRELPRLNIGHQYRYTVDGHTLPTEKNIITSMGGKGTLNHYRSETFPMRARPIKSSWED